MLVSNFTEGDMQEELFMNFKEGMYTMITVSWNYGQHTLEVFLIVELMKQI